MESQRRASAPEGPPEEASGEAVPPEAARADDGSSDDAEGRDPESGERRMGGSKRGIETMFRTAYRTHLELSAMADQKANMLISINGLIISVIVAASAVIARQDQAFLVPAAVLLVSAIASVIFAVLTAIPRMSSDELDIEDVRAGKGNILFFGTFTKLAKEDFLDEVAVVMQRKDRVYERMAEDLYNLGGVLGRKYKMIRIAYMIFLSGIVVGGVLLIGVYALTLASGSGPFGP